MKIICAYNVNIDAVCDITANDLSRLIESSGISPQPKAIAEIKDLDNLLSALLFCIENGSGAELLVSSSKAAGAIENSFSWSYRLGGNAGNMANALAELGAEPVLNVPSSTPMLASYLNPRVLAPGVKDGCLHLQDAFHFVLQFGKGAYYTDGCVIVNAPRENRLIATFDSLNKQLYVNPSFEKYCHRHIREMDGAIVAGFHLLPDAGFIGTMDARLGQIRGWKKENPDLFIHMEMGSFQRSEIMQHLFERISQDRTIDSIGMNEDELAAICSAKPTWREILRAARRLRDGLGISRVCVHTRDFIISAIKGPLRPEAEMEALEYGAAVAAEMARSGRLDAGPHAGDLSSAGVAAADELSKCPGAARYRDGGYLRLQDAFLCLMPCRAVLHPLLTVGLGDAMTAAVFYKEMKAIKSLA